MVRLLRESVRLLRSNFLLFSAIVLTVWLPGNILLDCLSCYVYGYDSWESFRITILFAGIFEPICAGALVYAVSRRKQDLPATYGQALRVGLRNWGRLFWARVIAGWFISLGLVALVVPGIMLVVRYALLDPVVVLEGVGGRESTKRSSTLTKGMRWRIFGVGLLLLISYLLFMFLINLPLAFLPEFDNVVIEVILDSAGDILFSLITIAMVLFYLEAGKRESAAAAIVPPPIPA